MLISIIIKYTYIKFLNIVCNMITAAVILFRLK